MKKIFAYVLLPLSLFLLAGCAQDVGTNTYSSSDVGQVNKVVPAKVVSMRPITVSSNTGVGGLAGAGAGAVAGSLIGGSTEAHILGGIGGAVVGGVAGNAIEKGISKQQGMEYVLRVTKDKSLVTVTQLQDLKLYAGEKVLIIYGKQTRVVPDDGSSGY
jgi:outer membrane lipoprotein SlyB